MSLSFQQYNPQPEDVGEILVKVQDDLHQLKERLLSKGAGSIEVAAVEEAISKTEDGIRRKTEQLLQQLNNRVLTLPTMDGSHGGMDSTGWTAQPGLDRGRPPLITLKKTPEVKRPDQSADIQIIGPTPGQVARNNYHNRAIMNPYNQKNRDIMKENYGIQLPIISKRKPNDGVVMNVTRGSTIEPLAVLPHANRVDPQLLPPPITETDARKGILSLIERGLIPPAAELTLDPSPVKHGLAPLHDPGDKEKHKHITGDTLAIYRTESKARHLEGSDNRTPDESKMKRGPTPPEDGASRGGSGQSRRSTLRTPMNMRTLEMALQPLPPPTTPASAPDYKDKQHRFAIQHGRIRDNTKEYQAFKQHYCLSWGSIVTMVRHLEKMLTNFAVPIAFVNGDKLADLSLEFELEKPPTIPDLLSVIVNLEDVLNIIRRPGRRFVGPNGKHIAASKIQATYRMYRQRKDYMEYRRKKWAAGVIAISWVMHVKMSKVRRQLKQTRRDQLENFRERQKTFSCNWDRIKLSKRVIIHIPSLGYSQNLRNTVLDINTLQNVQMARICDIQDPNVDVIFISPVELNDDMSQYYVKLFSLKSAIDSGDVDNQQDMSDRFKILTPESTKSFPSHRMCLSTILKYSDRTLKRLRNLIRGREAYIVTGVPHEDDVYLSEFLDVPVLSPEPDVSKLYTTKSGSKRIFASASAAVPPSEYDVYSLPQLHECLAQLVTENLEVTRWLFKLDDEFDGRGIAYLDIADQLQCYPWALKEALRYGDKWNKKWAQEAAYMKIHGEIPDVLANYAAPCQKSIYPDWEKFLEAFLAKGGIIEACPPSESITALTVDMLIEPNGHISLVSNGDQIHAESQFSCWGMSIPQSSVEPDLLNDVCMRVAEACKARAVIGYFSVDFVTFIHPKTLRQELWAVDLDLYHSNSRAMFSLITFTTGGFLDYGTHYFNIHPPKREEKKGRRRRLNQEEDTKPPNTERFAVLSTKLWHTNLSVVHYSVFFQMCRAHGIGYDVKEKQGSVFTLVDGYERANLGMVTISDNLQGALATFARNLSVIHQEISAPNMQGNSNFKAAIEDIENILGTTVLNAEEQPDEQHAIVD